MATPKGTSGGTKEAKAEKSLLKGVVLLLVAAVFGGISGWATSIYNANEAIEFQKYTLMTEHQGKTVELLNRIDHANWVLVKKYDKKTVNDRDVPQEDLGDINDLIVELNTQIQTMYLIMPDNRYEGIKDAIPEGENKFQLFKDNLLCNMRKAQFPDTKYQKPDDYRYFEYLESKREEPNKEMQLRK